MGLAWWISGRREGERESTCNHSLFLSFSMFFFFFSLFPFFNLVIFKTKPKSTKQANAAISPATAPKSPELVHRILLGLQFPDRINAS